MKTQNVLKRILVVALLTFALSNFTGMYTPQLSLGPSAHAQTANQKANAISRYRTVVDNLIAALEAEKTARRQYDALDLGTVLVDGDFTGDNMGLTKAQFVTAVAAADTIQNAYGAGVRTSLYKVAH